MRMTIAVPIINPEIEQGYLPKVTLKDGILMGEVAVKLEGDQVMCMVINTTFDLLDINIEPQMLEEFEFDQTDSTDFFPEKVEPLSLGNKIQKRKNKFLAIF